MWATVRRFGAELFAIETHLLNFHPIELTPETEVEICFLERLRDEIKFPSVEALREQIARDVKKARRYFHLLGNASQGLKPPFSGRVTSALKGPLFHGATEPLPSNQSQPHHR